MLVAEAALLQAVRDKLIDDLNLADNQCDVELDDQIPAIAKNDYFAVTSGGISPGPRHQSSGGIFDVKVDVKVTLFRRVPEIARDRRRHVFLDLMTGTALQLERVIRSLDYSYSLMASASAIVNAIIQDALPVPPAIQTNSTGQWPEPFRSFSIDRANRMIYKDIYDAAQMSGPPADPIIAISRGVLFQGARYMQVRT